MPFLTVQRLQHLAAEGHEKSVLEGKARICYYYNTQTRSFSHMTSVTVEDKKTWFFWILGLCRRNKHRFQPNQCYMVICPALLAAGEFPVFQEVQILRKMLLLDCFPFEDHQRSQDLPRCRDTLENCNPRP